MSNKASTKTTYLLYPKFSKKSSPKFLLAFLLKWDIICPQKKDIKCNTIPVGKHQIFLKARADYLAKAESFIVQHCQKMVKTPEDSYYYHLECQKARQRANQNFSQTYWAELNGRNAR